MEVQPVLAGLEAAVSSQLALAGADPAVETAASMLLAALEPALRQAAVDLAQQAAAEVGAQLPGYRVEVVLVDGEPSLRLTEEETAEAADDYEARITLRVPQALKGVVEEAASEAGDSVNSWVVKTLRARAKARSRRGRRITGSYDL